MKVALFVAALAFLFFVDYTWAARHPFTRLTRKSHKSKSNDDLVGTLATSWCKDGNLGKTSDICNDISYFIVDKLKTACTVTVDTVCSVAIGFTSKCATWMNSVLCPELEKDNSLQSNLASGCSSVLSSLSSDDSDDTCRVIKGVVTTACDAALTALCTTVVIPFGTPEDSEDDELIGDGGFRGRMHNLTRAHKADVSYGFLGAFLCNVPPMSSIINAICE